MGEENKMGAIALSLEDNQQVQSAQPSVQAGVVERLVNVIMEESDYDAIKSTKQDIGKIVNFFLSEYAKGGILIPANKVAYLGDVTGVPLHSSGDIVQVVENVTKRNCPDGNLRVSIDVDSAFAPGLEDLAHAQGRTVNEIVHEMATIVLTNGWIYSISLGGGTIPLSLEQRVELEKIMRVSPITSDSLLEWARAAYMSGPRPTESIKQVVQIPEHRSGKIPSEKINES